MEQKLTEQKTVIRKERIAHGRRTKRAAAAVVAAVALLLVGATYFGADDTDSAVSVGNTEGTEAAETAENTENTESTEAAESTSGTEISASGETENLPDGWSRSGPVVTSPDGTAYVLGQGIYAGYDYETGCALETDCGGYDVSLVDGAYLYFACFGDTADTVWIEKKSVFDAKQDVTAELSLADSGYSGQTGMGTLALSFQSDGTGKLLYCSDAATGQMGKCLLSLDAELGVTAVYDLSAVTQNYPVDMEFCSGTTGMILTQHHGEEAFCYLTEDGGATWTPYWPAASEEIRQSVNYIDGVSIQQTDDGTWQLTVTLYADDRTERTLVSADGWRTWQWADGATEQT